MCGAPHAATATRDPDVVRQLPDEIRAKLQELADEEPLVFLIHHEKGLVRFGRLSRWAPQGFEQASQAEFEGMAQKSKSGRAKGHPSQPGNI
jgi:hypothetical protein